MMKKPNPIIKFNGGKPVAICNNCSVMICYVKCTEKDGEYCKITEVRNLHGIELTTRNIGEVPPPYCYNCETLFTYSLN